MNYLNPNVDLSEEDIQKATELLKKLRPDGKGEGFDLILAGYKQIAEEWSAMTGYPFKDTLELLLERDAMMSMADGIRIELLGEREPNVPRTTPEGP